MNISREDTVFLQNVVRDFWIPEYLKAIPDVQKRSMRKCIEEGTVRDVIARIPSWCLYRFLFEEGYSSRLASRKKQLCIKDRYGDIELEGWFKELREFIHKRIDRLETACNAFPSYCQIVATRHSCANLLQFLDKDYLFSEIDSHVNFLTWQDEDDVENEKNQECPTNGYEFEHYVARILKNHGWSVQHTGRSGDQGADLIAEKESRRYVIQCKSSTYPISNSAVQEAHAGRGFHRVPFAAVVTNSVFTRSARQLAASVGVDLLHVRSVRDL